MNKKLLITFLYFILVALSMWFIAYFAGFFSTPDKLFTPITDQEWEELAVMPQVLARGELQYKLRCYKCHGYNGEGNSKGPSLLESSWIEKSDYNDIYEIIHSGRPELEKYGYSKKLLPPDIKAISIHVKKIHSEAKK